MEAGVGGEKRWACVKQPSGGGVGLIFMFFQAENVDHGGIKEPLRSSTGSSLSSPTWPYGSEELRSNGKPKIPAGPEGGAIAIRLFISRTRKSKVKELKRH